MARTTGHEGGQTLPGADVPMTRAAPSRRISDSKILLAELRQRLGDPDLKVVDVRALPAYNGWRSAGAARGGHIPGAVAFPSPWLESVDAPEGGRLLPSKGILSSHQGVLYGGRPEGNPAGKSRLADLRPPGVPADGGGRPGRAAGA